MQNFRNGGMGMQTDNGGGFGGQQRGGGIGQASPGGMTDGIIGQTMGGSAPGPGMGGSQQAGPWNNFGMGDRPGSMSPRMINLQRQCSAGDGRACSELQIASMQWQDQSSQWNQDYNQAAQGYGARTGSPMGQNKWG